MVAAAGDAHSYPIYGANFRVVFPILDADGDLVTGAATPDSERSIDQGTFADCTNEATEIATGSGVYYLDLTGVEMTANCTAVIVKSATAGAKTTSLVLYTRRMPVLRSGTAQAGAASTITLDSGASAKNGAYAGLFVLCTNDTPTGAQYQARRIISYVGSTKVATVSSAWGTNPSSSTTFSILIPETVNVQAWLGVELADWATTGMPVVTVGSGGIAAAAFAAGAIDASAIAADAIGASELASDAATEIANAAAAAVWDLDATTHQTAGTFGKAIGDPLTATNSLIQRTPDAVAGATSGLFIAGTNAATTVTTALTTTFTGNVTGSVGSVATNGITATSLNADAITAAKVAADVGTEFATALLDLAAGVETGATVRQALRLILAASAGDGAGAAGPTATFKDTSGAKTRISAAVDGSVRTVTRDVS